MSRRVWSGDGARWGPREERFYNGSTCVRCGSVVRYRSSGECVGCKRADSKRRLGTAITTQKCLSCGMAGKVDAGGQCKSCRKRRNRINNLRHHYGLGYRDYWDLWEIQDGLCALCKKPLNAEKQVDVDHEGGRRTHGDWRRVRGLLHPFCNRRVNDNTLESAKQLVAYLFAPPARRLPPPPETAPPETAPAKRKAR